MNRGIAIAALIVVEAGGAIAPAWAESVTYQFWVNVTAGPLAGNTFNGTFTYDANSIVGQGTEIVGVDNGLSVNMDFLGETYTETADTSYPAFPQLVLQDGEVQQLDFWIEPGPRVNWWNLPGWQVDLKPMASEDTLAE